MTNAIDGSSMPFLPDNTILPPVLPFICNLYKASPSCSSLTLNKSDLNVLGNCICKLYIVHGNYIAQIGHFNMLVVSRFKMDKYSLQFGYEHK
jgi:hypothetical protein